MSGLAGLVSWLVAGSGGAVGLGGGWFGGGRGGRGGRDYTPKLISLVKAKKNIHNPLSSNFTVE